MKIDKNKKYIIYDYGKPFRDHSKILSSYFDFLNILKYKSELKRISFKYFFINLLG